MNLKEFFQECREQDVFKNLSIYIVSSWVLLQVFALVSEPLGFPKISLTYLLLILIIGFPIYVYLIWRYRIKEEHIEESDAATEALDKTLASAKSGIQIDPDNEALTLSAGIDRKFRKMYFLGLTIIALLATLSAFMIINTNLIKDNTTAMGSLLDAKTSDKIAILKFDNNTGNAELDMVGKIAVDWIMHGITQNKAGEVISPKLVEDYSNVLKASIMPSGENAILTEYLKPSKVIIGDYYLNNGRLLIQASITDANMNETLIALQPVECDPDSPLDCIEAIKQRVLGFLILDDGTEVDKNQLQERPPKYKAYQYFLQAEEKGQAGDDQAHLRFLELAIEEDSTYFEPKVNLVAYYYNNRQYVKSDSLLRALSQESSSNDRQVNLLNFYEAILEGNNRNTFKYLKKEYDESPKNLATNYSLMTMAQQFINRPDKIDSIYKVIPMENFDLEKCLWCEYRYYLKGLADIELGRYEEVVELLTPFSKLKGQVWLKQVLIRAHLQLGNEQEVTKILSDYKIIADPLDWADLNLYTAKEFILLKKEDQSNALFNVLLDELDELDISPGKKVESKAWALFYGGDYIRAEEVLEELLEETPENPTHHAFMAITYFKNNRKDRASATLNKLDNLRAPYQYGSIDYALAQYYGAIGQEKEALQHLLKAAADGRRYLPTNFQYDPLLQDYQEHPLFQDVMDFWK
ncbi:MAG: tetratricopeptide repeat protein [Eudoraea sp.]|nr:tetratricopeptide repeat protein [Eudoraea sp.]